MTPKEKAIEIVRNYFDIIAKSTNYKGLKKEGEAKFYAIENVAKKCSFLYLNDLISELDKNNLSDNTDYYQQVKQELNNL